MSDEDVYSLLDEDVNTDEIQCCLDGPGPWAIEFLKRQVLLPV